MSEEVEVVEDCLRTEDDFVKGTNEQAKKISEEIFKKLHDIFNISMSLYCVHFTNFHQENYGKLSNEENLPFGETACLLCTVDFKIFYYRFQLKILYFQYGDTNEILKFDVALNDANPVVNKELVTCFKLVRRRRNLNVLFKILINFSKCVESRRLIILLILRKHSHVFKLEENTDGGIIMHYENSDLNIRLSLLWNVTIDSMLKVMDTIYMYQDNLENLHQSEVKSVLESLQHPGLQFIAKYNLWKHLISKLSSKPQRKRKIMPGSSAASDVLASMSPASSGESRTWNPYEHPSANNILPSVIQNLATGAFRNLFPTIPAQTPYGLFNRYGFGLYPQMRPPITNFNLSEALRRQQQHLARSFANSYRNSNSHQILSSSRTLSESAPVSENRSYSNSNEQTSTSSQSQSLSHHESEQSTRRASQNQRSKMYQKYVKYRNNKYLKSSNKLNSSQTAERTSVIQNSRFPKKRRVTDTNQIVEPDVEIVDMSKPSSSHKINSVIKIKDTQSNSPVITKSNTIPKQPQNLNPVTKENIQKADSSQLGDLTNTHLDCSTQIMPLNNNVLSDKSDNANADSIKENFGNAMDNEILRSCLSIANTNSDCELDKITKKINPFSLKFKDKFNKNEYNTKNKQVSKTPDCVLILSDNKGDSTSKTNTKDCPLKNEENVVYIPD